MVMVVIYYYFVCASHFFKVGSRLILGRSNSSVEACYFHKSGQIASHQYREPETKVGALGDNIEEGLL